MWLSQNLGRQNLGASSVTADITISDSLGVTASNIAQYRSIPIFAPYGISYLPKSGDKALIVFSESSPACSGILADSSGLLSGELRLKIPSGAYIHLKNDGSVVINGLVISSNGQIIPT